MGAKLHDIGKMFTQSIDDKGVAHYYGHEGFGAYFLLSRIEELQQNYKTNKKDIMDALFLVNYHMKPFSWENPNTHKKYRQIFGEEKYRVLLNFHECDKLRKVKEKSGEIKEESDLEYEN